MKKIINSGETGVESLALYIAQHYNIDTGGYMPKGYLTDIGPDPHKAMRYNLEQSNEWSRASAIKLNVVESNGVLIFGQDTESAIRLTIMFCQSRKIPYLVNPSLTEAKNFLHSNNIEVLNITGTKENNIHFNEMSAIRNLLMTLFHA